jgi:hypothetical protein
MHAEHLDAAKPRGVPRTQLSSSRPGGGRLTRPPAHGGAKLAHLLRRRHGRRRARVRGLMRVAQDWWLLAAVNLARFAVLGV